MIYFYMANLAGKLCRSSQVYVIRKISKGVSKYTKTLGVGDFLLPRAMWLLNSISGQTSL